jgi:hypothetical protein
MAKPINIGELLRRGGELSKAEAEQLTQEMREASLIKLGGGILSRDLEQPVKVVPAIGSPPNVVRGFFTQQKFVWNHTAEEMERILGIFGKLRRGAYVLQFEAVLKAGDFESRAYTYLPDGKEYKPDPKEAVYLPGAGAPQWVLTRAVQASCLAHLKPGERLNRSTLL